MHCRQSKGWHRWRTPSTTFCEAYGARFQRQGERASGSVRRIADYLVWTSRRKGRITASHNGIQMRVARSRRNEWQVQSALVIRRRIIHSLEYTRENKSMISNKLLCTCSAVSHQVVTLGSRGVTAPSKLLRALWTSYPCSSSAVTACVLLKPMPQRVLTASTSSSTAGVGSSIICCWARAGTGGASWAFFFRPKGNRICQISVSHSHICNTSDQTVIHTLNLLCLVAAAFSFVESAVEGRGLGDE